VGVRGRGSLLLLLLDSEGQKWFYWMVSHFIRAEVGGYLVSVEDRAGGLVG